MPRLENWSVVTDRVNAYNPPEAWVQRLAGEVYDHPKQEDGKRVETSIIVTSEGRRVTTRSGTVYELGKPDPQYVVWLRHELGREIDPANPVKSVSEKRKEDAL